VQFIDLKAQYEALRGEIDANIAAVLAHGKYIMGPEVAELEKALCDYTGSKHCITCANGTDALQLALMALGIKEGDAVFVPSFTFMSTAEAVSVVGATPIFVDIDENTFNIDCADLEEKIGQVVREGKLSPKAVIPVDLFGQCADYTKLLPIAEKNGLFVIEDAAQGFGGSIGERRACTFGHISTTSFFPAKPLGCYGDGGAMFTDDDALAELLRSLRIHGKGREKYDNVRIGLNSRLDTLQAAVLLPKLRAFDESELESRNALAAMYTEALGDIVRTPFVPDGFVSSWAQYTIVLESAEMRDALKEHLAQSGIPSMVYYPKPLHLQQAFANAAEGVSLPVSESTCERVLSLPMHPYMSSEDAQKIICAVRGFIIR